METHPWLKHFISKGLCYFCHSCMKTHPAGLEKRKSNCLAFIMCFALQTMKGIMSQKPLSMEQLKQVLQLKKDGVVIREIVRRTGISRNAIKRYLNRLEPTAGNPPAELTNKQLADKAYDNDALLLTTDRQNALTHIAVRNRPNVKKRAEFVKKKFFLARL